MVREPRIGNAGHQAVGMESAGLGSQEKPKGEKPHNQLGKVGAGSFPRNKAIEKVRRFDAVQVFS